MNKIISIQNSGESIEKCIALFNTAIKSDELFYTINQFEIFYGHNLPKKDNTVNSHGTIGFYLEFFSDCDWNPIQCEQQLLIEREKILDKLLKNNYISNRNFDNLIENDANYIRFVKRIPMAYIFPELIQYIKGKLKKIFTNTTFKELFLESNFMECYASLPVEKWAYSIFALNIDGTIGRYYLNNLGQERYYNRNLVHMFKDLSRKSVLSGNSALFLSEIENANRKNKYIIGYREHKRQHRLTRNFALKHFLENKESIIEPKNTIFTKYYSCFNENCGVLGEVMSNMVIAKAYRDFLEEYSIF